MIHGLPVLALKSGREEQRCWESKKSEKETEAESERERERERERKQENSTERKRQIEVERSDFKANQQS